jgi:hypothetical protein
VVNFKLGISIVLGLHFFSSIVQHKPSKTASKTISSSQTLTQTSKRANKGTSSRTLTLVFCMHTCLVLPSLINGTCATFESVGCHALSPSKLMNKHSTRTLPNNQRCPATPRFRRAEVCFPWLASERPKEVRIRGPDLVEDRVQDRDRETRRSTRDGCVGIRIPATRSSTVARRE